MPTTNALPSNPNLKYFAVWDGNPSDLFAVSEFSNLIWVNLVVNGEVNPNLSSELAQIQGLGKKAILYMLPFGWVSRATLNPPPADCPASDPLCLDPNFLPSFQATFGLTLTHYADTIVAFYPFDEPFSNGISDGSELASEIAQVKSISAFSNWKAAVVFSTSEISGGLINNGTAQPNAIPTGYDWVGVDCYTVPGSSSFESCEGNSIPGYLGVLADLPNSPNKFIINPTAKLDETNPSSEDQQVLVNDDEQYMKYALGNLTAYPWYWNNVVAIMPFEYDDSSSWTGLQSMPEVQAEIEPWGSYISRANTYYPLKNATSTNVLSGWPASNAIDGSPWTAYSSNSFPTSANPDGGTFIAAWLDTTSTPFTVQNIALTPRTIGGFAYGFPQSYEVLLTSADNSTWVSQGYFPTQPNAAGVAIIQLPEPVQTYGVMINPTILGTDNYGNHYFQLAEIGLQGPLGTAYSIPMESASASNVLSGWPASNAIDGPSVCCYSSNIYSSSANPNQDYFAAWTDLTAGPFTAQNLVLTARTLNGVALGFPKSYSIQVTAPDNSSWIPLGTYTNQPNSAGVVTIPLPQAPSAAPSTFGITYGKTYGVMITPTTLSVDNNNNYVFQLAQVGFTGYY